MPTILQVFELIAFVFSFFTLHQNNQYLLRILIVIMFIVVAAESIGYYFRVVLHKSNHNIYNISVPLVIILLFVLFHQQIAIKKYKLLTLVFAGTFVAFVPINIFFLQSINRFATYNYILGGLLLTLTVSIYFIELIKKPNVVSLFYEPMFLIATGVLLMYLPKSIMYTLFEYLSYNNSVNASFADTFFFVNNILGVLFYGILSVASICKLIYRPSKAP